MDQHSGQRQQRFIAWDNFTLASNPSVTSVSWRGFAWDFVTPANNPVNLQTMNWGVAIYSDAGGAPGVGLVADIVPAASVSTTLAGTAVFNGDTVNVYDFAYTFSAPFAATGGTQYWFTPLSFQTSFNPIFSWSASNTGDNQTFQCSYSGGSSTGCQYQPGDRALSIYGTSAVPEPSSMVLLGTGLAALGGVVRRRRI